MGAQDTIPLQHAAVAVHSSPFYLPLHAYLYSTWCTFFLLHTTTTILFGSAFGLITHTPPPLPDYPVIVAIYPLPVTFPGLLFALGYLTLFARAPWTNNSFHDDLTFPFSC